MKIEDITTPKDIKHMSNEELTILCNEIRKFIIENVSKTGGHLSSNLGVVELTVALHYVFNAPKDKIFFDVGHQCYTHKILTGRAKDFSSLRMYQGLSGFQKKTESIYDCWEAGHSSTSLSAALGMAIERDLNKEKYEIIPIIGDGSISNGMSLEALNHIGEMQKNMIIILNDNGMSISKNHGALNNVLTKLRISASYLDFKSSFSKLDKRNGSILKFTNKLRKLRDSLKNRLLKNNMFSQFNIDYLGPIDGHDLEEMINAFKACKKHKKGPIIVHIVTKKGKGYLPCENDNEGNWHGVSKFDIETGKIYNNNNKLSYSQVVGNYLVKMADKDDKVVVITPAMKNGSCLSSFASIYPNRFFDVGISEEHGATFAAGLANNNIIKPYYVIYSTFAQRCYDQINHDIARMDLPVRILLDRSGLVGNDGPTHHGVFDISIFNSLPNITICTGVNNVQIEKLLDFSLSFYHPFILRYPRGNVIEYGNIFTGDISYGKWEQYSIGNSPKCIIITYGEDVINVYYKMNELNIDCMIVNALFIKPIDKIMLDRIFELNLPVFIFTADCIKGGLIDSILEYKNDINNNSIIYYYGVKDRYVPQGNVEQLRKDEKCDIESLIFDIEKVLDETR